MQHNVSYECVDEIQIRDIRGGESSFELDTHGFQFLHHSSALTNDDFEDDSIIRRKYYPEIIDLVTDILRAPRVIPFEHTVSD